TVPINLSLVGLTNFVTPIEVNRIDPLRITIFGATQVYESYDRGNIITPLAVSVGNDFFGNPMVYGGRIGTVANADLIYVASGTNLFARTAAGGNFFTITPPPGFPLTNFIYDLT